jgi:2-C-methyl-D-erythritol 4-phosphate cytidylyltransferase
MKKQAIIVAGGKGVRMGSEVPKQFLLLAGRPVLMYTLEAFYRYDKYMQLILALPVSQQDYWLELCKNYGFSLPHKVVSGGETRFHSVKNGLVLVDDTALVAVHDGVRPFVAQDVIARSFEAAEKAGAAIPVTDVAETIREIDGTNSHTVERGNYKLVQTPQVFNAKLLKSAYSKPYEPFFSDDASVVESLGVVIQLIEGNRENIKITTPFDLQIGECILMHETEKI